MVDRELEFLLSLAGFEFRFAKGYRVRVEARRVAAVAGRAQGIRYGLTLHDPAGRRRYRLDNTHKAGRRREFDHRHVYGARKIIGYSYRGAAALLEDFYREAARIVRNAVHHEAQRRKLQSIQGAHAFRGTRRAHG